jgi:hypothetical protein
MVFSRTQHHPVFAEGDRLLVLIRGDMPDGQNRHCNPMIRLCVACIFWAKIKDGNVNLLRDNLDGDRRPVALVMIVAGV